MGDPEKVPAAIKLLGGVALAVVAGSLVFYGFMFWRMLAK